MNTGKPRVKRKMGEIWVVNDDRKLTAYIEHVKKQFCDYKYLTFSPARIGADRSLDQNSLMHLWLTEFAAHLSVCHTKEVTEGMLDGIKRSMKGMFYRTYGYEWMIHEVTCPLTKRSKKDFTSSKKWKRGEMFMFLDWLQHFAATKGCILESAGEFAKLQREQNK
jgi:hypothetical protein